MKQNDKILIAAVIIAVLVLTWSPARADLESAKINLCHAHEGAAQSARKLALKGQRSMITSYIQANFTGLERDTHLKVARWGFTFYSSTPEQLKEAFLESCLSSLLGALDMPDVDKR